jgi:hypothetical protein
MRRGTTRDAPRQIASLFDHLVCGSEQRGRHRETERFGGLEVDDHRVFVRRLDWQVGCLLARENAIDVACREPKLICYIWTVRDKATARDVVAIRVDRRRPAW